MKYFVEEQGYKIKQNVVYEDNTSAIMLENNGKGSSGKRMKHMDVRYFFVKDRIDTGDITICYCPTGI